MKVYESKDIRNVGVVGHGDSGKTTLTAGLLFTAGATNRLLRVDEGNTITDFDEEEIQRKITISTAIAVAEWKKTKINLLDTPGYNIFINDTRAALVAADAALVRGGRRGRRRSADRKGLGASPTISSCRAPSSSTSSTASAPISSAPWTACSEVFGRAAVPIQIPIGAERDFKGVVDLVRMKAYTYTPDGDGKGKEGDIPGGPGRRRPEGARSAGGNGGRRQRRPDGRVFRQGHAARRAHHRRPASRECARCASSRCCAPPALHNIGSRPDSEFHRGKPARAHRARRRCGAWWTARKRHARSPKPALLRLYVFKTTADPFAGRITYFKVYHRRREERRQPAERRRAAPPSGWPTSSSPLGKTLQPVTELHAGDIGAVAKLKDTLTGDTLADKGVERRLSAGETAGAFHRLRHRSQVAQRRRPHGQRRPPHPGRGPVAALLPRPADARVPAGGHRPAARGNRGQPAEEALRRGCHAEGAQDSLSRDHPRHGRRAGAAQEADRRSRPVRRLLDQDGAAAARRQVRVRQRDFRRLHSQELHPGGGKGHRRGRRERAIWPAIPWWISR